MIDARALQPGSPGLRAHARAAAGWGWYPTLLALAFVGRPFSDNDVAASIGVRPFLIALAIGIALTLACARLLGRDRGAAIAAILLMGLVAASSSAKLALIVAGVALISIEGALSRRGRLRVRIPWPRITEALNVILLILVVLQIGHGVQVRAGAASVAIPPAWAAIGSPERPDIFVILPDSRGRSDVLARDYGYDAAEVRKALTSLDFDEATRSQANHVVTAFSLAVLLNGRPLSEMGQDMEAAIDGRLAAAYLANPSLASTAEAAGYEYTVISTGYDHLGALGGDRTVELGPPTEIEQLLWASTAVGRAVDSLGPGLNGAWRERVLRQFAALDDVVRSPSHRPQFVFTHLPVPHWPFVFSADCSLRPTDSVTGGSLGRNLEIGSPASIAAVVEQTQCIDRLLVDTVRRIVAARPNAVVIVVSDHGPEELLDWRNPGEPGLEGRFANTFWARTPGRRGLFPDDVTLVNVLPILFNAYLGTDLPLHSNDLWFGPFPSFVPYATPDVAGATPYRDASLGEPARVGVSRSKG